MASGTNKAPAIKSGWARVLIFYASFILVMILTGMLVAATIAVSMTKHTAGQAPDLETVSSLTLAATSILSLVVVTLFRQYVDRRSLSSMGFNRKGAAKDAVSGFLLGTALLGAGSLILYLTKHLHWLDINPPSGSLLIAAIVTLLVVVAEEAVFRGYILGNLLESFGRWPALLVAALLFTLTHSANPGMHVITIINIFLGGLLLGINYSYTRNLYFSILLHFSWNFIQGPILGFAVSGVGTAHLLEADLTGHALFTGGSFGFEGSIAATLVLIAGTLLLYLFYERSN